MVSEITTRRSRSVISRVGSCLTTFLVAMIAISIGLSLASAQTRAQTSVGQRLDDSDTVITVLPEDEATDTETEAPEIANNWRNNVGSLVVGYLVEGHEDRQRRRLEPFRRALERAIGLRVTLRSVRTLDELISMQISRRIQYAIHSSSSYVSAKARCKCVESLAVPTDWTGARGVFAVIIAPFNGSVRSVDDLKGQRLAIPAPPATITRALPLAKLAAGGYDEDGDLGTLIDVKNPVDGWRRVLAGEADAVVGWSSLQGDISIGYSGGTLNHIVTQTGLSKASDIRVVWQSDLIPYQPHAIRSDVPTPLKTLLRDFLFKLKRGNRYAYDAVSPELSGGFVEVPEHEFNELFRLTKQREATLSEN